MKILYLHQYFNTPDMSGGTRSYEMARRFVKAGHDVHIVTSWREHSSSSKWFTTNVEGVTVHWLPVMYSNNMSFTRRILAFFRFAILSSVKAIQLKSDIIFATSTPLTIAVPAVISSKFQKVPLVFEVRDLWPELPIAMGAIKNPITIYLAKFLEKFAYNNSSSVVALSPGMKEGIVKSGFPSDCVSVIPNSSDNDLFDVSSDVGLDFRASRPWLGDKPLLLYTGTFGKINGVDYLVDLAYELSLINSEIQILAIGGGSEFDDVISKSILKGVYNVNIFFESYLKKSDVPAALNASTIACALFIDKPEMRPNSANKFFDALAASKPLFINYGGWMHDLIVKRHIGLSMWKKSLPDAAKELDRAVQDKSWLKATSLSSKNLALNEFNRDILAEKLLNVLCKTLEGHPEQSETIAPGIYGDYL